MKVINIDRNGKEFDPSKVTLPEEEGGDAIGPLIEVEGEVVDYNETFYPDGGYFRRGVNGLVAEGDEQDYLHTFYQLEDLTQTF